MSTLPKVYAALLELAATGKPIASDRMPLPEIGPKSAPDQAAGIGYEFRRTVSVAHPNLSAPVEAATSLFMVKTPQETLLLCTLADWTASQGPHRACVKYNVSPEVVLDVVQRIVDDRMDSPLEQFSKHMADSVYKQPPHAASLQMFPLMDEYRRTMAAEIAGEPKSAEDAEITKKWEASHGHHERVIMELRRQYAQLNMLCSSLTEPAFIEAHTLGAILTWARKQPEISGRS